MKKEIQKLIDKYEARCKIIAKNITRCRKSEVEVLALFVEERENCRKFIKDLEEIVGKK